MIELEDRPVDTDDDSDDGLMHMICGGCWPDAPYKVPFETICGKKVTDPGPPATSDRPTCIVCDDLVRPHVALHCGRCGYIH